MRFSCNSIVLLVLMLLVAGLALPSAELRAQRHGRGRFQALPAGQVKQAAIDSLAARLDSLGSELEKRLRALEQKEEERELEELLEEAEVQAEQSREDDVSLTRKFRSGARQLQALNPNISVNGDFFGAVNTMDTPEVKEPGDFSEGSDRFRLREVELDFTAALDPFTRGRFFIGIDDQGEIGIEEGYMEWLNLPLNLNMKIGQFNAQFGEYNRWHTHALPEVDRPRPLVNLFSLESLGGAGVSGNILLPSLFAHVNELTLEVFNGGNGHSFNSGGFTDLVYVARLKNYYDLNRDTYLELGLSGASGSRDEATGLGARLAAADLTLKWAPVDRVKYRTVEWHSEIFFSRREMPATHENSWGVFSCLRGKLNSRFWLGARADYSELPWDSDSYEYSLSPHIDCWQSEWVMLRAQYTHLNRSYGENENIFYFQCCWAMGPHKHEAY